MYNHIMQENSLCCGAACMQMVYDYFDIMLPQDTIWNSIIREINGKIDCGPENMQKHFHENGFCSMYALAFPWDFKDFISIILNSEYTAIINYTIDKNIFHFVLLEEIVKGGLLVQNPLDSHPNSLIPFESIVNPQVMLVGKSTKKSKCPYCHAVFPSCDDFNYLYSLHITRCAYCNNELYFVEQV